jgi:hypothetical protein
MGHKSSLARLDIRWGAHQKTVDSGRVKRSKTGHGRGGSTRGVESRHERQAPMVDLLDKIQHPAVLFGIHHLGLTRAAEHHQEMGLASTHMVDHPLEGGKIDAPLFSERRDEGHAEASKSLGHFKSSVFK